MLALTKIKRSYVIDHVMPSDLDKDDIKHGLYLKEKMISEITDDYVKSINPDWRKIERDYRRRGLTNYIDKIMCGEMTYDDFNKIDEEKSKSLLPIRCEAWLRWKKFNTTFYPDKNEYDFDMCDCLDGQSGYCNWIKMDSKYMFTLTDCEDVMVHMKIAIIGEQSQYYYPLQDSNHSSGWEYVDDELKIYDCSTWDRISETDNRLKDPIEKQNEYYRLFFRNRLGYPVYNWYLEDKDWNLQNYPNEKVRTIFCDPFRVVYKHKAESWENPQDVYGSKPIICGHQFVKTRHITDMISVCGFTLIFDNMHIKNIND